MIESEMKFRFGHQAESEPVWGVAWCLHQACSKAGFSLALAVAVQCLVP